MVQSNVDKPKICFPERPPGLYGRKRFTEITRDDEGIRSFLSGNRHWTYSFTFGHQVGTQRISASTERSHPLAQIESDKSFEKESEAASSIQQVILFYRLKKGL